MSRKSTYSMDGTIVGYGPHYIDDTIPAVQAGRGAVKTAQVRITVAELILAATTWTEAVDTIRGPQQVTIPRGSRIVRGTFMIKTAFNPGTALTIGTWGVPSRPYSITAGWDQATGIMTATEGAAANLTAGAIINCNGACISLSTNTGILVGTTSDSDCIIAPLYTGTVPTTGDGILLLEYIVPGLLGPIEV
jgi:hypothetical protein